ncbi:hypothetical protein [Azospirillum endophyticum]
MDVNLDLWARHVRRTSDPGRLIAKPSRCRSERLELARRTDRVNRHDGLFHRKPIRDSWA